MIALAADRRAPIVRTMHITTPPADSTRNTSSTNHRRRAARCGLVALAIAAIAVPAAHGVATNTNPGRPVGGCTLTPTADSIAFVVTALVSTVRSTDGVIEVSHDAHCTDGRVGTVWIAADIV